MLDGIGAYTDRDKYLARSLTVLGQMEGLVQEPLTLCRMEQTAVPSMTPVDLAACIQGCIQEYAGLFEQRKLAAARPPDSRPLDFGQPGSAGQSHPQRALQWSPLPLREQP